ncbi:proteasomal ubiquitin receptor ADRM1-A [Trichonephila inaurata madagascariensis]|uniref:Proteasomal ubiquitin receptor ADRM1 homolog n=1 Tax=Trichonephila inaurata madagascariensis TaxID=2747483 RepID=A0A8X6XH15_9ARAC|nr:proteasomal ubiquitin receptor ADRM1-A [Trichonephila inaurata madagascariensis]
MTRSFLFGGASTSQSQNKYLVEFRAGKMSMKNMIVSADKRKGLVFVYQTDDSLMHFCWKDRTSGIVEDDLIIFPDDVVFKKVPECTTGRVFVLKFKSSSRRCFYWLQEPKTDRDNEYCCKVNQFLNNPPAGGSSRSGTSGSLGGSSSASQSTGGLQSELSSLGDGDLQNLLSNMSQSQLIQLLGRVCRNPGLSSLLDASRPSSGQSASSSSESTHSIVETTQPSRTTTSTTTSQSAAATPTPASTASSSSIQLSDLQNILSGLTIPPQGENQADKPSVDLSSAITAEALQPLFNNQELMDRVRTFYPPATTEASTPVPSDQLRSTVQSPQFQQALGMFSAALQSGQLGPLMQQFGMSNDVVSAANSGDMDAFVRALQSSKESSSESSNKDKKDQDKDEDMALD